MSLTIGLSFYLAEYLLGENLGDMIRQSIGRQFCKVAPIHRCIEIREEAERNQAERARLTYALERSLGTPGIKTTVVGPPDASALGVVNARDGSFVKEQELDTRTNSAISQMARVPAEKQAQSDSEATSTTDAGKRMVTSAVQGAIISQDASKRKNNQESPSAPVGEYPIARAPQEQLAALTLPNLPETFRADRALTPAECRRQFEEDTAAQRKIRLSLQDGDQCHYFKVRAGGMLQLQNHYDACFKRKEMLQDAYLIGLGIDRAIVDMNEKSCDGIPPAYKMLYDERAERALRRVSQASSFKIGSWTLEFRPPQRMHAVLTIGGNPNIRGLELLCSPPDRVQVKPMLNAAVVNEIVFRRDQDTRRSLRDGLFNDADHETLLFELFDRLRGRREIGVNGVFSSIDYAGASDAMREMFKVCLALELR